MKIVVTGGAGRLGRLAIRELLEHGHDVLATDRVLPGEPPPERPCPFLLAELIDAASVFALLRGADAVLHLGAIPGPGGHPEPATFHNNVQSTYCVVHAAAILGVRRLVFASTVFALGWHPEADGYWPRYVPVDEEHPLTPFEAYGLSKQIGEAICAAACRRTGMTAVSLRIMNVIHPDGYAGRLPWPAPSRQAGVRFVMWPYVDARDVARACRLALEADTAGHEAVYLAARDTRFDAPTEALLRDVAPDVRLRMPLPSRASVIDSGKAKALLGWEPLHHWQDARDALRDASP
jgi:nucleoside-diphosphate-sugar epimerase